MAGAMVSCANSAMVSCAILLQPPEASRCPLPAGGALAAAPSSCQVARRQGVCWASRPVSWFPQEHLGCREQLSALRTPARGRGFGFQRAPRSPLPGANLLPDAAPKAVAKVVKKSASRLSYLLDTKKIDDAKYEDMLYRRVVFKEEDWRRHRSSGRHGRHILSMAGSRVISSLAPAVTFMVALATALVAWNTAAVDGLLPPQFHKLTVNPLPFSLISPALAFLLVFRTNSSYGRFDEARKMWGGVLNRCRDIARLALTYVARDPYGYENAKLLQFLRHLQAFPLTFKFHLVNEGNLEQDLGELTTLSDKEIAGIIAANHRPMYLLQIMGDIMRACHVAPAQRISVDEGIATLADYIGGCERIYRTPIPLSYTRLTSRFLVLWHCFLPFALWDGCGLLTVPATLASAGILFCVDEVGVLIEEPFSLLALGAISATARRDIDEFIAKREEIQYLVAPDTNKSPDEFYSKIRSRTDMATTQIEDTMATEVAK